MSEHEAEQTGGESGSLNVGTGVSASSGTSHELSAGASGPEIAPGINQPEATAAKPEEASKAEASKPEAPKSEPRIPGKVIVMSPRDRGFGERGAASEDTILGKRRLAALAAVVALAAVAGALGGAMATSALMRGTGRVVAGYDGQSAVEASLSRMDADIQALKAGFDHASKLGISQFNKTSDRLDKLERAQAEPAAKLAKLGEAIDKLRAAPAAAPVATTATAPISSRETTGSIPAAAPPASQQAATPPKSEVGRLPTLDGWVLRDVAQGGALIDGRRGIYEVYAGDVVPGLGRIDSIRRQDGRWVVVTSRGLIVAR